MKTQLRFLAGAVLIMLATGNAWALGRIPGTNPNPPRQTKALAAPEIDAASGTSAIALLTGVLLLMNERSRRSRSRRDEDNSQDDSPR
jgi:hypothetical protein